MKSKVFARLAPYSVLGIRSTSLIFLTMSGIFLTLSFIQPGTMSGVRMGIADTAAPILSAVSRPFYVAADFVGNVSGMTEMRAENVRLEAENKKLREWYQTALMLQSENQSLQELLNLKVDGQHKFVSTRVIADAGNAYVKSVLVGAGGVDGVKKGQAVLSGEGMVGRIIETGNSAARVLLLSDFNSRVPVIVEGSRHKAILAGTNESYPALKHLPPDVEIVAGTRIVTSGDGGIFPPGLPIGKVVIEDGVIRVHPYADMNRVTYVRILDVPQNPNLHEGILDVGP
jgi:rod shape-determining protein MreC